MFRQDQVQESFCPMNKLYITACSFDFSGRKTLGLLRLRRNYLLRFCFGDNE